MAKWIVRVGPRDYDEWARGGEEREIRVTTKHEARKLVEELTNSEVFAYAVREDWEQKALSSLV